MLSRIAESLFWMGRYLERADGAARIVDVHLRLFAEDPWAEEEQACRALLGVMGAEVPGHPTRQDVLSLLAWGPGSGTVVGALSAARENARRARESVSTEMWEAVNMTWLGVPSSRGLPPYRFFAWVHERAAMVAGIADATMSRDLGWHFLVAGRSIERADMTARLLASRAASGTSTPSWPLLLRSCGGYEAFSRAYHGVAGDAAAADFLLRDPQFPRSVAFALSTAEGSVRALGTYSRPGTGGRRPATDDAARLLGLARSTLEYQRLDETMRDLPAQMRRVQGACTQASDAVAQRFFPSSSATSWVGGMP